MGTNTDPYQPVEGRYRLTRGVIEVLTEAANPFSILTKSTLIGRDIDLLAEAATRTEVSFAFSIGCLDEDVGVELLGSLQEEVAVALPAFLLLERVHQETDLGSWLLLLRWPRRRRAAGRDGGKQKR